jgi:hypothetical protein
MAMPINMGSPLVENLRSARVNTNGSTGKMHGLKMVSTPAKNTMQARITNSSAPPGFASQRLHA